MTPVKRVLDFAGENRKTLSLSAISKASARSDLREVSEQYNAMAGGVNELQGNGKTNNWREVLLGFTNSISEKGKTVPGCEDICSVNWSIGLKRTKAHLSRALDKCGVRGTELENKLTSFQRVKDGI